MSVIRYLEEYLPAYAIQAEALKRKNWKISKGGLRDFIENTKEVNELLADVLDNPALLSNKDKRRIAELIPLLEGGSIEELRNLQSRCIRICLRTGQPFTRTQELSEKEKDSKQEDYNSGFRSKIKATLESLSEREKTLEEKLGEDDAEVYLLTGRRRTRDFEPQIQKELRAGRELLESAKEENLRRKLGLLESLADRDKEVTRLSEEFKGITSEEASDILIKAFQIEQKRKSAVKP